MTTSPEVLDSREGGILVVDDDDGLRTSMEELLNQAGFVVEGAEDGLVALERVASRRFDALVLDLHMPRLGGLELLEHLAGACPPVVIVSADEKSPDEIARHPQVVAYLRKPVSPKTLLEVVGRLLER